MTQTKAALTFNLLAVLVIIFQLALALGMPWGELTWGGSFPGALPPYMRGVCVVSALLLTAFVGVVSVRAGLLLPGLQNTSRKLIWVVVAYSALGVVANIITPSFWERVVWLPMALGLFVSSFVVARKLSIQKGGHLVDDDRPEMLGR